MFVDILIGSVLLLFGQRLFWLFVACVGFTVGFSLAGQEGIYLEKWVVWLIGVGCGLIGIFVAIFLQKLAVAVAGFLAGAYLTVSLMHLLSFNSGEFEMIAQILGGVVGLVLLLLTFDWALIILSSLLGASLIVNRIAPEIPMNTISFIVLTAAGMFLQYRQLEDGSSDRRP